MISGADESMAPRCMNGIKGSFLICTLALPMIRASGGNVAVNGSEN